MPNPLDEIKVGESALYPFYRPADGDVIVLTEDVTTGTINGQPVLRFGIIKIDKKEAKRYVWTISRRENTTDTSKLGQIVKIRQQYGSLDGIVVKITIFGKGRQARYRLEVQKQLSKNEFEELVKKTKEE